MATPYLCVGCGKVYPDGRPTDGCKCGEKKEEALPNAWTQTPPEPKEGETWRDRPALL